MQEENLNNPEQLQEQAPFQEETAKEEKPAKPGHPFFVFTINTVLGLVILAGLIVLYILFFTRKEPQLEIPKALQASQGKTISVVHLNIDTLNQDYDFIRNLRKEMESSINRLQGELKKEEENLRKDVTDFQQKVGANAISEDKAKQIYEILMQRQQGLVEKKDRYSQMMASQQLAMSQRLNDTLINFLKRYNRNFNFDYIMGFKSEGEILISNDSLDITRPVLNALNREYQERKK